MADEQIYQMHGFQFLTLFISDPLDVHQAAGIIADQVIRAGLQRQGDLAVSHAGGNGRELGGERSAEAAALDGSHLDQGQALDMAHQDARLVMDAQFTQSVTTVMEGDFAVEGGSQIGHAQLGDQKVREFPGMRGQLVGLGFQRSPFE